jgi:hypothetical protein
MKPIKTTNFAARWQISALMIGYYIIGLGASFCFKEGGTDLHHRLLYFISGNALGITSTVLLMGLYARVQVNVAMVLATSGAFLLTQLAFWLAYHTALTPLQALGIVLIGAGSGMASFTRETTETVKC